MPVPLCLVAGVRLRLRREEERRIAFLDLDREREEGALPEAGVLILLLALLLLLPVETGDTPEALSKRRRASFTDMSWLVGAGWDPRMDEKGGQSEQKLLIRAQIVSVTVPCPDWRLSHQNACNPASHLAAESWTPAEAARDMATDLLPLRRRPRGLLCRAGFGQPRSARG